MKKKKGFTLTEILGVLVILGLLLLLIVPTILNKVRVSENDTKKTQDKMIEESTNLYMDDNKDLFPGTTDNVYCIPIQTLIDHGKITEDLKDVTSKDPNIKKKVVKVKISKNGNRVFETVDSCSQIQYKNIVFAVGPKDNSQWTTSKYVTITYPNMGEGYVNKYSTDNGKTWKIVVGNTKKTEDYTADGKVMARMEGPTIIKDEYPVKRIDRTAPTITSVTGNPTAWTKNNVTLTVNGAKDTGSGLNATAYSFDNGATWQASNQKTYTTNTNNIIIKVRDILGNTYTHSSINITKIDKTAPTITSVTGNPTAWTKNNVTLTVNGAKDTGSGLNATAYSFDGGSTWQASNQKTYTSNTSNISIKVRDAVGNIYTNSNINITKIDKTPPYVKFTGFKWTNFNGTETSNTCKNKTITTQNGNASCDVYIRVNSYTTWQWDTTYTYVESGSGVKEEQGLWQHNGSAPKYNSWVNPGNWWWDVERGTTNSATYLNWSVRYVDNVGNVGNSLTVKFHLSY
ncbi:MAG: prepilin-type N-terminal cleavage/methylation domain-containing protein [Bacilli bacterium]